MPLRYETRDDVAVLTLDRPAVYNAIDTELSAQLQEALSRAAREARAAVLTGAGKAFCSGADIAELMAEYEASGPDLARVVHERFNPVIRELTALPIPTIAAINGIAAGAGMGLALACDLRVMAIEASMMSAFINLALIPDSGTTWFLTRSVGLSRAMEIAYSGRKVGAEECEAIGLAHRLSDAEHVLEDAVAWATRLADGPTTAYVATRELLRDAAVSTLSDALEAEKATQGRLGRGAEHLEGMAAFVEKRRPDFRAASER